MTLRLIYINRISHEKLKPSALCILNLCVIVYQVKNRTKKLKLEIYDPSQ